MLKTIFNKDSKELARQTVVVFSQHVNELLKNQDQVVLAISGGRSVLDIFYFFGKESPIDWQKIQIFMLDERLVPLSDPVSNFYLAKQSFIDRLVEEKRLPAKNVHPFIYNGKEPGEGTATYDLELTQFGGKCDIVIAGVGEDGHIGSLFPNHPALDDWMKNFTIFHDSPKPPPDRMTSTPRLLGQVDTAFILFINEAKKAAYKKFLDLNVDHHICPAKLLAGAKNSYLITNINL